MNIGSAGDCDDYDDTLSHTHVYERRMMIIQKHRSAGDRDDYDDTLEKVSYSCIHMTETDNMTEEKERDDVDIFDEWVGDD